MRLLAPAKINLHLRVGPRRADGFHPLLTWMCTVGLFDTLRLECAGEPGIALVSDLPGLPCDGRNLVVRIAAAWGEALGPSGSADICKTVAGDNRNEAATRTEGTAGEHAPWAKAAATGTQVGGLRVQLEKRIPVGAGLGGGSSDAARTLLGLCRLWRAEPSADFLSEFAARFGSDVPFFLFGPSSICTGRGEKVRPVAAPAARWAVLLLPAFALGTAEVYRAFDALGLGREQDVMQQPDWDAWARCDARAILPRLGNDLEPAAFNVRPELGRLRADVEQTLARPVRMSGSGSSLFSLFDTQEQAQSAADEIMVRHETRAAAVELAPDFQDGLNASPGTA